MRVLVTGGLGFIGSNFIRHILDNYQDINVINIDNLSSPQILYMVLSMRLGFFFILFHL